MRAYWFCKEDMTAGEGDEPPWREGEERTLDGKIELCTHGYHSSPSWLAALSYAPGPMACLVDVSKPEEADHANLGTRKQVSRRRRLVKAINVERELRLFACNEAERSLKNERKAGREPAQASWDAVRVARLFANGHTTTKQLSAAWSAASSAASSAAAAAEAAAWSAASSAAAAAEAAAWSAAAEAAAWSRQRRTLARRLNARFRAEATT